MDDRPGARDATGLVLAVGFRGEKLGSRTMARLGHVGGHPPLAGFQIRKAAGQEGGHVIAHADDLVSPVVAL